MKLDVSKMSYAEIDCIISKIPFAVEKITLEGGRVLLKLENFQPFKEKPQPHMPIAAISF